MTCNKPQSLLKSSAYAAPQLLWGVTHLHTSYSFDAFLNGNQIADPDTAHAFASGQPVIHPGISTRVQLNTPLDFLVIPDHAEFYGGIHDATRRYGVGTQCSAAHVRQCRTLQ